MTICGYFFGVFSSPRLYAGILTRLAIRRARRRFGDVNLSTLRNDSVQRNLEVQGLGLVVIVPTASIWCMQRLELGLPVDWGGVAEGLTVGVATSVAVSMSGGSIGGVARGVVVGVAAGIVVGVVVGAAASALLAVFVGVAAGGLVGMVLVVVFIVVFVVAGRSRAVR